MESLLGMCLVGIFLCEKRARIERPYATVNKRKSAPHSGAPVLYKREVFWDE